MSADDFKGNPEDRELYLRLLLERDGPPDRAADERDPAPEIRQAPEPGTAQCSTELAPFD
ncbi:hypothetical protein [Streptomyces triticiradicis]|uniref:Uncharacterized protein n=1 Tax=Streptomyces triticiradicis TaxID=2651189 RepID=A0A7J5DM44_9ACTN|nr:hypothetical protein [Streptomyces triticiradicis]KAB1989769.1 hypothetical protein F8144_05310 [Streptomyces triticiradicis]